jgi:sulfonate transport system substrate-binding protein
MSQMIRTLFLLLLAVLTGCGREAPSTEGARQAITLALPNHPTSALVLVALDRGLFAGQGLDVQVDHYPSGKRALEEGLLAGRADMAVATDTPLALAALKHPELRVLASVMSTDSVSRIVVRRDLGIETPADLRGKPMATQSASAVHFFLHQFLLEQGMSDQDVKLEFLKIEELPDALASGRVAAISTREPYISPVSRQAG